MLYRLVRPALFSLPEETVHHLTLSALRKGMGHLYPQGFVEKPVQLMGLTFRNPVGMAAGLDKNADCIDGLAALGFGFIEVGTVTPRPQAGNPKPRLFRLPKANAIINRMGFNNQGLDYFMQAVRQRRYDGVLGINIGKNATTPMENAVDDYLLCLDQVHSEASYVVVNVSSPNTEGLRSLQHGDALARLLSTLRERQTYLDQQSGRSVPLVIKIAPDNDEDAFHAMGNAFVEHGMDGVIVSNTTLDRVGVEHLPHGQEAGGLSGQPVKQKSDQALKAMVEALNGKVPVIGVGGIMSAEDALHKKALGAELVQIYTGLIYQGPKLVNDIAKAW